MDSRREFLKKAALLAAGGGMAGAFPASIQKAFAIDPTPGTTYLDAEHIVILMQENRSFDHCYGALKGVRGFDDPRAVDLPDGNPVWLQSNQAGDTYAPFRLNIKDTKATWMSALPHSWVDQTDARNDGKHDGWLEAKRSGNKDYAELPLTLGYYNRDDLPFYYALADAFTVCDQNFCSSLTGTTPNRLHLWTGTIRKEPSILSKANVRNEDVDYGSEANWTTFPERLEDLGVSWRIYQNELSLDTGLKGEEEAWLANFTDNPIEWFSQFRVRFHEAYHRHLPVREKETRAALEKLEAENSADEATQKKIAALHARLNALQNEMAKWDPGRLASFPPRDQNLHRKAFTTNAGDPHYRELTTLTYQDGGVERTMQAPKGDVLHQFREDVRTGNLPTVSWLVAPENFSDHPGAPWYGAWYLSEVFDILTTNPEVWRKTIFLLCYDENDGYFDHVPPFVPPAPDQPGTGKVSPGIDVSVEYVRWEQEEERRLQRPGSAGRAGPIGLGFRVPLVVASPWSRGGFVNSQVCDHTSILQFLEKFLSHKTGQEVRETNISEWRRTVCGDLTSVFRPYHGEKIAFPQPVQRDPFLGSIHQAQFKQIPSGFKKLTPSEIARTRAQPRSVSALPRQEPGVRPSCALPYQLDVSGVLSPDRKTFAIQFGAGRGLFGDRSAGAPFHVYAPGRMRSLGKDVNQMERGRTWAYAVAAGERISDAWVLEDFAVGIYHLRVHGPNGFYREFRGSANDANLEISMHQLAPSGKKFAEEAILRIVNRDADGPFKVEIEDAAYGGGKRTLTVGASGTKKERVEIAWPLRRSHGWYDLSIRVEGSRTFTQRWAGRMETGKDSFSDPQIGA